jgi:hypothetical protein
MSKLRMQWLGLVLLAAGMLLAVQSWAQPTYSQEVEVTDNSSLKPLDTFKCVGIVCASGYCCVNSLTDSQLCAGQKNDICCESDTTNSFTCSRDEECSSTGCVSK